MRVQVTKEGFESRCPAGLFARGMTAATHIILSNPRYQDKNFCMSSDNELPKFVENLRLYDLRGFTLRTYTTDQEFPLEVSLPPIQTQD